MFQHNTTQSQAVNRRLEQPSENPHKPYLDEWHVFEENRKIEQNLQACAEWEAKEEVFLNKFKKRFTSQEILAKIMGVFADLPLSASAVEQELRLLEVKQEVSDSVSARDFDRLVSTFRQDWRKTGYKLELKRLLQIDDPIDRNHEIAKISSYYQTQIVQVNKDLRLMQQAVNTPAARSCKLDELLNESSEAIKWLIPELLPVGETVLLVGAPKDGKTLLALDAAFAIATGEDAFLGNSFTDRKKVMLISVDESKVSTRTRLTRRGFRSKKDRDYLEFVEHWDISQMSFLEKKLEDFRPDLVIVDSLKRITVGQELSENSAEFANAIYQLKELFTRYGAAGILIHHTNKNPDSMGVDRARGSSAIAGATWGQWQIERIPTKDPNNKRKLRFDPKDQRRIFSAFNRDSDGVQLLIEFNPENNSWHSRGEFGIDEAVAQEQATLRQRILTVLEMNRHRQLSGKDIIDLMEASEQKGSVYSELSRMVNKRLVNCQPASEDKRYNVYSLPKTDVISDTSLLQPPPLPPQVLSNTDYVSEIITQQELQDSQQLVSNSFSISQQENTQNSQNSVLTTLLNSQQASTETEGGGGSFHSTI